MWQVEARWQNKIMNFYLEFRKSPFNSFEIENVLLEDTPLAISPWYFPFLENVEEDGDEDDDEDSKNLTKNIK